MPEKQIKILSKYNKEFYLLHYSYELFFQIIHK